MQNDTVYFKNIPLAETMPGRVAVQGKLSEITLVEIIEEPTNHRFRWWILVKVDKITHKCLLFHIGERLFISVNLTAIPHCRKEFYLT